MHLQVAEAKCLAIGPAAPPDDQLDANIAAAENMNLTVTSGAGGLAAVSPGAAAVVAMGVGFSILLLLTQGP